MKIETILKEAEEQFIQEIENKELWLIKIDDCDFELYDIVKKVVKTALTKQGY